MIMLVNRIVLATLLSLLACAAVAQDLSPQKGERSRIVILDASGSMRSADYSKPRRERMAAGREILEATFQSYRDDKDTTPTGLIVFGSDQKMKWDDVASRYNNKPRLYPNNGPLCLDSKVKLPFARVDRKVARAAGAIADDIKWAGMTLTHVAIQQALNAFDPTLGGDIVLISDMTQSNCLPDGAETVCDAITPALNRISAQGGYVRAVVFGAPDSTAQEALSDCMPTREVVCPTHLSPKQMKDCVEQGHESYPLSSQLRAGGANNLDPEGINPADGTIEAKVAGLNQLAVSGPLADIELVTGAYFVTWTLDAWSETKNINIPGDNTVPLVADPSRLHIKTETATGGAGPSVLQVAISRPGGTSVATVPSYNVGQFLELANGDYVLEATDPSGAEATSRVSLKLGVASEVTLTFGASPTTQLRNVSINVDYAMPTLRMSQDFGPSITLSGNSGSGTRDISSGFSGTLAPGKFVVEIASLVPHSIPLTVAVGADRLVINLVVTPGIFIATAPQGTGTFELKDSGGNTLYSFMGDEVRHSITDGHYTLSFTHDGNTQARQLALSAGDRIELTF